MVRARISNFLARASLRWVRAPKDFPVCISQVIQLDSMMAAVPAVALWRSEPIMRKVASLARRSWNPDPKSVALQAKEIFHREVFGDDADFGPQLMRLASHSFSRERDHGLLTEKDQTQVSALAMMTVLTQIRLGYVSTSSPRLNLGLGQRAPTITLLANPMVLKTPLISVKWFLHLDFSFSAISIRAAKHASSDELISYIYETLYLQQKTALTLLRFFTCASDAGENKGEALMLNTEVDALMSADLAITYLKATIEKALSILALSYDISGLSDKRRHGARIALIEEKLSERTKSTFYARFALGMLEVESFRDIDSYRNGLLHKMGIGDLQPHRYVGIAAPDSPFRKVLGVLLEQHAKNTALLVCVFAMLTDRLFDLLPPSRDEFEWMRTNVEPDSIAQAKTIHEEFFVEKS